MTAGRRLCLLAILALAGLLVAAPASGAAQANEWEIRSFEAEIVVDADGGVQVTETIAVTFHVRSRGIYREIPFRVPVGDDQVRRYRFDQLEVRASEGAPGDLHQEQAGDYLVWRIGDPDTFITGDYTYVISYRVRGALNRFAEHDELFWNVTGDRWEVPIQLASATVQAPGVSDGTCFAGYTGQTDPCAEATHDERSASFRATELAPGQQLDVVVAMPPGVVDVPPPELEPADEFRRFVEVTVPHVFQLDPLRAGGAVLVGLVGLAGVAALAKRGRDERSGAPVGGLPGGVEYRPPDGLRPAQLRTLLTQRVDDVSLSATLVDLAVRGHVRIEEVERTGLAKLGRPDWIIHQQPDGPADLQPYEKEVLTGLFARSRAAGLLGQQLREAAQGRSGTAAAPAAGGTASVLVSGLRNGVFHPHYRRITKLLYGDVVHRGFFRRDPSQVRTAFGFLAVLVLAAGIGGIVGMFALEWTYGLVLAPLPVIGLLLLLFSRWAPRRTTQGSTMNRRAQGFREFVRTAEADRMDFAERERIFVDYLPYAMVFGCVDRWVRAFERIGVPAAAVAGTWYVGHGPMDVNRMTSSMSSLSSQVGGSMRHTASSSGSSGFSGGSSGGGGGGGGGGRW